MQPFRVNLSQSHNFFSHLKCIFQIKLKKKPLKTLFHRNYINLSTLNMDRLLSTCKRVLMVLQYNVPLVTLKKRQSLITVISKACQIYVLSRCMAVKAAT